MGEVWRWCYCRVRKFHDFNGYAGRIGGVMVHADGCILGRVLVNR